MTSTIFERVDAIRARLRARLVEREARPDKAAIAEMLGHGQSVPGARFAPGRGYLRVR